VTRRSYGFRTYEAMQIALITRSEDFRNLNRPTDFAEEAFFPSTDWVLSCVHYVRAIS
jgi:hypothetical protein